MFKNVIAPMQAWLLSQGKCVGCGKLLPAPKDIGTVRVTCGCGRIYVYDPQSNKFRRATFNEAK